MGLWVVVVVGVVGLGIVLGGFVLSRRAEQSLIEERLGITDGVVETDGAVRKTPVADALNRALAQRGVGPICRRNWRGRT